MKGDTRLMRKLVVKGVIAITLLVVVLLCANTNNVNADQTKTLTGDEYQFTDSEKYNIDEKTPVGKTSSAASNLLQMTALIIYMMIAVKK